MIHRSQCRTIGLLLVCLVGCAPETSVLVESQDIAREPGDLISQLAGSWQVHAQLVSDCPSEWQQTFPTGQTVWRDKGDHLSISFAHGGDTPLMLRPKGPETLVRVMHVQIGDCHATENLTLTIDPIDGVFVSGIYSAILDHNGDACATLLRDSSLPEQCETLVHWQAKRIGIQ